MRPLLLATSVSIRRPVPLLLVVQSRDCQLLLVPQKFKTTISQMLDIINCHNRYLKAVLDQGSPHPVWIPKTKQVPRNRDVNISAVSESCHLGLIPTDMIVTDYAQWYIYMHAHIHIWVAIYHYHVILVSMILSHCKLFKWLSPW